MTGISADFSKLSFSDWGQNIPLPQAKSERVGEVFSKIFSSYATTCVKIGSFNSNRSWKHLGTGSLISETLLLTVADIFSDKNAKYTAILPSGGLLEFKFEDLRTSPLNYALLSFQPSCPLYLAPVLGYENSASGAYGMLHYGNHCPDLLVTVGEVEERKLAIGPGPGSSGSLIWNTRAEAIFLHAGRSPLMVFDIILDEQYRFNTSWILRQCLMTSVLEDAIFNT